MRVRGRENANNILGEITSRMWHECTLRMEIEAFLSALPSSGIEGQIVLVVEYDIKTVK